MLGTKHLIFEANHIATAFEFARIPQQQGVIIGGASLVLRNLYAWTLDLDMLVSDEVFEEMSQRPGAVMKEPPLPARNRGATNLSVQLEEPETGMPISCTTAMGDGFYPISFAEQIGKAEYVGHFPLMGLGEVINSKQALQRRTDIDHLRSIREITGLEIDIPLPNPSLHWTS